MMIKKMIFFLGVMIISIIAAGCTTTQQSYVQEKVFIGTEGLRVWHLDKAPPDEVYEGERFDLILMMHNVGAYDIKEGYYSIGIEPSYISSVMRKDDVLIDSFQLNGRNEFDPYGSDTEKRVSLKALDLDPQKEIHTTTITSNICYPYKTKGSVDVCIDTDIYGRSEQIKPCIITPESIAGGQGAPIAVTLVETKILPHDDDTKVKPQFTIHIQNMGAGQVLNDKKVYEACTATGLDAKDLNQVTINANLFEDPLYCSPKLSSTDKGNTGHLKLEGGYDYAICTLEKGISKERGTYTAPLTITLDYGYMFTLTKRLDIKRIVRK